MSTEQELSEQALSQGSQGMEAPMLQALPSDSLHPQFGVWALTNDAELERIEHFLKGDEPSLDSEGNVQWQAGRHDPVMNEQGVYEIMRYLHGLTSKLITLSDVRSEQYYLDLMTNANAVCSFLYFNYRKFELDPLKYRMVCTELTNYIQYSLAKARDKATMEFVHPKHRSVGHEITHETKTSSPPGIIDSFMRMK